MGTFKHFVGCNISRVVDSLVDVVFVKNITLKMQKLIVLALLVVVAAVYTSAQSSPAPAPSAVPIAPSSAAMKPTASPGTGGGNTTTTKPTKAPTHAPTTAGALDVKPALAMLLASFFLHSWLKEVPGA